MILSFSFLNYFVQYLFIFLLDCSSCVCVFLDIVLKVVPLVVLCSAGCLLVLIGSINSEHAREQKDFIIKN